MDCFRISCFSGKKSDTRVIFLLWSFIILCSLFSCNVTDALECFQCASTATDGGNCLQDNSGLVNASKGTGSLGYIKNCTDTHTDPPFNRCFIEYHLGPDDEYIFYHRGCHDGVTFNKKVGSTSRFNNLEPNNETTCAKPPDLLKEVVCFSFCDTKLCNGPQPEPEMPDPCRNQSGSSYDGDSCGVKSLYGNLFVIFLCFLLITFVSNELAV